MRFWRAVLAGMNWPSSTFAEPWPTLRPNISHSITMTEVPKHYALKFISDTGKQNGLYWESPEGQPRSPLGPLVAFATDEGYNAKPDAHTPFHGYYFHMLTRQGAHAPGGRRTMWSTARWPMDSLSSRIRPNTAIRE